MILQGTVDLTEDGRVICVAVAPSMEELVRLHPSTCEIRIDDGRTVSAAQRAKAWAIVGDICQWAGYFGSAEREGIMDHFKAMFAAQTGIEVSLSLGTVTDARQFITYLIDWALANDVPGLDSRLAQTDDINAYLYSCLWLRRCCLCNRPADVHHVDAIGMGADRDDMIHVGLRAMALCRLHHGEAHQKGQDRFDELNHVYGIKIDALLARHLKLGRTE